MGHRKVASGLFLELVAVSHNSIIAFQVFGDFRILVLSSYCERIIECLYKDAIIKHPKNSRICFSFSMFLGMLKAISASEQDFFSNSLEPLYCIHSHKDKVIFFNNRHKFYLNANNYMQMLF